MNKSKTYFLLFLFFIIFVHAVPARWLFRRSSYKVQRSKTKAMVACHIILTKKLKIYLVEKSWALEWKWKLVTLVPAVNLILEVSHYQPDFKEKCKSSNHLKFSSYSSIVSKAHFISYFNFCTNQMYRGRDTTILISISIYFNSDYENQMHPNYNGKCMCIQWSIATSTIGIVWVLNLHGSNPCFGQASQTNAACNMMMCFWFKMATPIHQL